MWKRRSQLLCDQSTEAYPSNLRRGLVIRDAKTQSRHRIMRHTNISFDKFWINGYDWKYVCPGAKTVGDAYSFVRRWPMWAIEEVKDIVKRIRSKYIGLVRRTPYKKTIDFVRSSTPFAGLVDDIASNARRRAIDAINHMYDAMQTAAARAQPVTTGQNVDFLDGMSVLTNTINTVNSIPRTATGIAIKTAKIGVNAITSAAGRIAIKATNAIGRSALDSAPAPVMEDEDLPIEAPKTTIEYQYNDLYRNLMKSENWSSYPKHLSLYLACVCNKYTLRRYVGEVTQWKKEISEEFANHLLTELYDLIHYETEIKLSEEQCFELYEHLVSLEPPTSLINSQSSRLYDIVRGTYITKFNTRLNADMKNTIETCTILVLQELGKSTATLAGSSAETEYETPALLERPIPPTGRYGRDTRPELFVVKTPTILGDGIVDIKMSEAERLCCIFNSNAVPQTIASFWGNKKITPIYRVHTEEEYGVTTNYIDEHIDGRIYRMTIPIAEKRLTKPPPTVSNIIKFERN